MKIVIIEPDGTGGLIHFSHMLGRGLAEIGAEVILVTATDYELGGLPHEFEVMEEFRLWPRMEDRDIGGIVSRVYRGLIRRTRRAVQLFTEMWRVGSKVAALSPDLVLIRPFPLPGRGLLLRRLKRWGAVLAEVAHEFEPRDTIHPLIARIERSLAGTDSPVVDVRLFLGSSVLERYASLHPSYPRSRMFAINHGDGELFRLLADPGCDPLTRNGLTPTDRVVLFFGNLRPSKGLDDLLEAFAVARRPPSARLLVAGYPSRDFDLEGLKRSVNRPELVDSVVLDLDYVPMGCVGPLHEISRFAALPYRSATQSGPLHVAMTYSKPVLATRIGGIGDVIEDGVNGLLVEPGDIDGLAAGLERLLEDDTLVLSMGDAMGRKRAEHSWTEVARGVLAAVETVRERSGT